MRVTLNNHIQHAYSKEMAMKSEVIGLEMICHSFIYCVIVFHTDTTRYIPEK